MKLVAAPVIPDSLEERYCNAAVRASENHYRLSRSVFPLDILPGAITDLRAGVARLVSWLAPWIQRGYGLVSSLHGE